MNAFAANRPSMRPILLTSLVALLLAFSAAGCDAVGDVFGKEKEVNVTLEEVNTEGGFVVGDGIRYDVTSDTEFEGVDGLSDLSVGDQVEIGYEESGNTRNALEIEVGDDDDDGGVERS